MAVAPLPIDPAPGGNLTLVPEYPAGVPVPDPPIMVVAHDVRLTWDHVWQVVKSLSKPWVDQTDPVSTAITLLIPVIEAFSANVVKTVGGTVNAVSAYAHDAFTGLAWELGQVSTWAVNLFKAIEVDLVNAIQEINHIHNDWIPQLEAGIAHAEAAGIAEAHVVGADVERWAIDNIFTPLHDYIGRVEADTTQYTRDVVGAATRNLTGLINSDLASMAARLVPIAASAAASAKWVDDCGTPMCDTMGPATQLGKLLKALALTADLALLAEFLSLDKAGVEARIHDTVAMMGTIITDFDQFVTGGETVGGFIAKASGL